MHWAVHMNNIAKIRFASVCTVTDHNPALQPPAEEMGRRLRFRGVHNARKRAGPTVAPTAAACGGEGSCGEGREAAPLQHFNWIHWFSHKVVHHSPSLPDRRLLASSQQFYPIANGGTIILPVALNFSSDLDFSHSSSEEKVLESATRTGERGKLAATQLHQNKPKVGWEMTDSCCHIWQTPSKTLGLKKQYTTE